VSETNRTLTQKVNSVLAELTADIKHNKLQLPSPPDLLLKVRATIADQESELEDIVDLVKQDPNISGRLIKVANSALLASRFPVTDVKAAIARLGSAKVQSLVTSLVIAQNFLAFKSHGIEKYFDSAWQQSSYVAAINYVLAVKKTELDAEQALLAGIVHNIGVLPLILRLNRIPLFKEQTELLHKVADVVIPRLYPNAGKLILENWNFPDDIVAIALTHSKPTRESTGPVNLNDITLISSELSKLDDFTHTESAPENLVNSATFLKLWANWQEASEELRSLRFEINEMKKTISN